VSLEGISIYAERVRVTTLDDMGAPAGFYHVAADQSLRFTPHGQPGKFEVTWTPDDAAMHALVMGDKRTALEVWMTVPPKPRTLLRRLVFRLLRHRDRVHWVFPEMIWLEDETGELTGLATESRHPQHWDCPDGGLVPSWAYWHTTKAPPSVT
jgi:hypothetical protein